MDNNESFITKVSAIIPARNEEENIENCLKDFIQQNYPKQLLEIIIVDDNSKDKTTELINKFKTIHPSINIILISLNELQNFSAYKKRAVAVGIENASGTLIITSDADCRFNKEWISSIVSHYEKNQSKFISAPVSFNNTDTLFGKIQSLEFMSLIGSGATAINLGSPNMCNGANIAFEKSAYLEVNGFDNKNEPASGDDMFLMLKIAKKYPDKIHFLKSKDAIVYTDAKKNLSEFYQQRKRWASKGTKYNNSSVTAIAFIVYLANLFWLVNFVLAFIYPEFLALLLILTGLRMLIEILFLYSLASFFDKRKDLLLYIPTFIFNIFYVIIIGVAGSIGTYEWKGRRVK
jgi:cellulose synthase/poly-beta-1,6-N-acetylglucosamine synthase-like glycosyltransferase